MSKVAAFATDSAGSELAKNDRVRVLAGDDQGREGKVLDVSGGYVVVEFPDGALRCQTSNVVKMALMMAQFHPGDQVTDLTDRETGKVIGEPNESNVQYRRDRDGQVVSIHPTKVQKMALFARADCPYCARSTVVEFSRLGDHYAPGGPCDGSRRRVVRLDEVGRAVLAAA